jgi:xylulokinase
VSPRRIYEITGLPVYPPYAVARIIWLRRRRPAQHRRVTRVLDWAAFIASRLGLPAATDPTIAARTMAWDISAAEWSAELLEAANIQVACFPAVVATGSVIGAIAGAPSRRLDLPAEVALVAGGMDQWLAAVGSGVTDTGQAMVGTGTWEALVAPLGSLPSDRETLRTSGISIGPFVTSAPYAALASQVGGGSLLRWFRGVFAPTTAIATLLQSIPDRPSGLLVLPHAEGSLSPWMDPESRIAIAGLSLETDRRKLLRGVLEGITLELRENVTRFEGAGITVGELRASGGGARSSAWLQLKADILGWPVTEVVVRHNAAFGAALLAGTGVGIFESVAAAAQAHVRTGRVFEPRASFVRAYDEVFDRYRDLYPAFRVARQAARGARLPSVESQPG